MLAFLCEINWQCLWCCFLMREISPVYLSGYLHYCLASTKLTLSELWIYAGAG